MDVCKCMNQSLFTSFAVKYLKKTNTKIKRSWSVSHTIITQEDSDSEVIICFGSKFKLSVDFIQ